MAAHAKIYTLASKMIDRFGPEAGEYAEEMFQRCLGNDDMLKAGAWLAIGNAIEDLTSLMAGEKTLQ